MNKQAYMAGYMAKEAKKKKKFDSWTTEEAEVFKAKHGKAPIVANWGVSFFKDRDGYFCATHRARSKSKTSPDRITKKELNFIESTG